MKVKQVETILSSVELNLLDPPQRENLKQHVIVIKSLKFEILLIFAKIELF